MPSNPKLQRLITFVREHHGGEEALLGLLRSGWTGVKIARHLEQSAEEHRISRDTIAVSPDSVRLMLKKFDEPAYHEALKDGAASLMEETVEIADGVAENRDAVAKAKLRVDVRANIAGKMDRERWGDGPSTAIQIQSTGALFLAAVSRPNAVPPPRPQEVVAQAEPEPKQLPAATMTEKVKAEVQRLEREEERKQFVNEACRHGVSLHDAERSWIQLEHQRPPLPPLPRVQDVGEEPDD